MDLKKFLIEKFNFSSDRASLLARLVTNPNDLLTSLDELTNKEDEIKAVGLNNQEIIEFKININDMKITALACQNFFIRLPNLSSQTNEMTSDEEDRLFEEFITYFREKYSQQFDELKRETYRLIFEQKLKEFIKQRKSNGIVSLAGGLGLAATTFGKIFQQIPQKLPGILTENILTYGDEALSYLTNFDGLLSHAGGALIMFGIMMSFSIYKNFRDFLNKRISLKQFLKFVAVDAAAYGVTTGCATAGSFVGGLIGTFFGPGLGTLIGSLIGGAIGGMISHFGFEPKIREFLNGKFLDILNDDELVKIKSEDLFEQALKTVQIPKTATKDEITRHRKTHLLMLHPDKNGNTPESNQNFVKYNSAYDIIIEYKTKDGSWND